MRAYYETSNKTQPLVVRRNGVRNGARHETPIRLWLDQQNHTILEPRAKRTALSSRHDLHSAGFVGLVQAVNKMAEHKEPSKANPTGYISVAITHEFVKLAIKEASHSNIELADTHEDDMDAEDDAPEVLHNIPESMVDTNQSAAAGLIELRDMLNACCQCEEERTLLRMREEGYSDREIAKTLNMPHTRPRLSVGKIGMDPRTFSQADAPAIPHRSPKTLLRSAGCPLD